jgi:hypothetical protein
MDSSEIPKKSTGCEIPRKNTSGKTMTEMGRKYQEGLLVAA